MTTFTMRIELTNLRAARKEHEALGAYLDYLEAEYAVTKDPIKQVEEVAKPTPKPKAKAKPKAVKEEPKVEEAPEPTVEVVEETSVTSLTHADLVALARAGAKAGGSRENVDKIIKRYGKNITSITPNNFEAVASELEALVK